MRGGGLVLTRGQVFRESPDHPPSPLPLWSPSSSVDAKVGFKRKLRGAERKMVPRRVLPLWFIEFSLLSIREQVSSALSGCGTRTRHISINVSFTKFLINFAFYWLIGEGIERNFCFTRLQLCFSSSNYYYRLWYLFFLSIVSFKRVKEFSLREKKRIIFEE